VKKPKFSLLAFWKEVLLPKLEALARKYGCVIRFQWDGAGPHTEEELVAWLRTEFGKRGWMFVFQPSQSPETNIHDFFIFPAMSKRMDHQTGGTTLLRVPQIAKAAMQVFQTMDPAPLHRSWAAHQSLGQRDARRQGQQRVPSGLEPLPLGSPQGFPLGSCRTR